MADQPSAESNRQFWESRYRSWHPDVAPALGDRALAPTEPAEAHGQPTNTGELITYESD